MELRAIKCPNCGADIDFESDREYMFCQYCGTKIALGDHTYHTERIIDEAAVKKEERKARAQELRAARIEKAERESDDFFLQFCRGTCIAILVSIFCGVILREPEFLLANIRPGICIIVLSIAGTIFFTKLINKRKKK